MSAAPAARSIDAARVAGIPTAASAPAAWTGSVARRLEVIRRMPEDWDRAGGAAPDPAAVDAAESLLDRLAEVPGLPKPLVEATRAGTVLIGWEGAGGDRCFDVEVTGPKSAELFFQDAAAREEWEREVCLPCSVGELASHVARATA